LVEVWKGGVVARDGGVKKALAINTGNDGIDCCENGMAEFDMSEINTNMEH
jgi:hypothetical protein